MDKIEKEYGFAASLPRGTTLHSVAFHRPIVRHSRCVVRPMIDLEVIPAGPGSLSAAIKNLVNRNMPIYSTEPKMNLNIKSNSKPAPRFNDLAVTTLFVMGGAIWVKTGDDNALKIGSLDYRPISIDLNATVRRIKDLDVNLDD